MTSLIWLSSILLSAEANVPTRTNDGTLVVDETLAQLLERGDQERQEKIKRLREVIRNARKQGWGKQATKRYADEIRVLRRMRGKYPPSLRFSVGSTGIIRLLSGGLLWSEDFNTLKVVQVLDDKNMLVSLPGRSSFIFWVANRSTAGLTDGCQVELPDLFHASGTKQYSNVLGSTRTVLVIEPCVPKPSPVKKAAEHSRRSRPRKQGP